MILLFAIGITLTSSAISWWNGHRTAEVQAQIDMLEAELAQIYAIDASARREMIVPYLHQVSKLIDQELATRNSIATELINESSKARSIKRFGNRERNTFLQVVLELELALSRVNAERAYLGLLKDSLGSILEGRQHEIPTPGALQLPNDVPREGGLVHFQGAIPAELHGYRLRGADFSEELGGRCMLYGVDHSKRTANVSTARAALLEANLVDGGGPLPVTVTHRSSEGIHFSYQGISLLLRNTGGDGFKWMMPEAEVEVYPEVWTLEEVVRGGSKDPLPVRIHPRVGGSRKYWSPIALAVREEKLQSLVEAWELISSPALQHSPWRLHMLDSGQLAFSLGQVTLITWPNAHHQAFMLDGVALGGACPEVSVRFHAGIRAFVPGTPDDEAADRTLFRSFVEAVHSELGSQKQMLLQRRTALRLRKLSLIYQDQEDHLQATGACGFVPGEAHSGGRVVICTITENDFPPWLDQALSADNYSRLRVVGNDVAWDVRSASWEDRRLGTCRLELDSPSEAAAHEIAPFSLKRIELVGEGSQQQTFSRAPENAILGKFASSQVHSTLLGQSGDPVPNKRLGQDEVKRLLVSDAEVVAIWGPPGTGKTTLLVDWLLSLFDPSKEGLWPTVLVTAPTHQAVDNLIKKLLMRDGRLSEEVVRYGNAERVAGKPLEPLWHQKLLDGLNPDRRAMGQPDEPLDRWKALMSTREGREAAAKWVLKPKHIHAATCVGMARRDYCLSQRIFDIAIIDEAGKAFGAELLLPSAVARRVILVGDHNQFPPTVTTEVLDESIDYRISLAEVEELLRRNMFHEIFEQLSDDKKGMLTMQYRMHQHIGDLVSELFYGNLLQSDYKDTRWTLGSHRLVFVDFSNVASYRHQQNRKTRSLENRTERAAMHALLHRLRTRSEVNGWRGAPRIPVFDR